MIQIEYWNTKDIIDTHYEGAFRNRFWLDTDIKNPSYPVKVEGTENAYGDLIKDYQRWDKTYKFVIWGTESMTDFLSLMVIHDNIWVTNDRGISSQCFNFTVDVEWQEIDCVAKITCTFTSKSYSVSGINTMGVC